MKTYHGWIVIEEPAPGMKPPVCVEWNEQTPNGTVRRREHMKSRGESGAAEAVEWWDARLGKTIKAEPTLKGCYRVYTEAVVEVKHG